MGLIDVIREDDLIMIKRGRGRNRINGKYEQRDRHKQQK